MANLANKKIVVKAKEISIMKVRGIDYISLTDIARLKNCMYPNEFIKKWMSNNDSFEFYSLWEEIFNDEFNSAEFRRIKLNEANKKSFFMTPSQWKKRVNASSLIWNNSE